MLAVSFSTAFFTFLILTNILICPCQENKNYLGISVIDLKPREEKKKRFKNNFFLGNGIKESDPKEAAKQLLNRDHKDVANLNENYFNGKLGAKFLPPMYFSKLPNIVDSKGYEDKTGTKEAHKDILRAENAERTMFQAKFQF